MQQPTSTVDAATSSNATPWFGWIVILHAATEVRDGWRKLLCLWWRRHGGDSQLDVGH